MELISIYLAMSEIDFMFSGMWNHSGLSILTAKLNRRLTELKYRFLARFGQVRGVTIAKRDPEIIVSLTTMASRIQHVGITIESIMRQSEKPDRIVLWLSPGVFGDHGEKHRDDIVNNLKRLEIRGLEIRWCPDIRSYRKLIPTLKAFPDSVIVTADDDLMYPPDWLARLVDANKEEPEFIHCHLAHRISFSSQFDVSPYAEWEKFSTTLEGPSLDLFPTTGGGIIISRHHLHADLMNEALFLKLCPTADDVWVKTMSLLAGTKCKKVSGKPAKFNAIKIANNKSLFTINVKRGGNDVQIAQVDKYYGCFSALARASCSPQS